MLKIKSQVDPKIPLLILGLTIIFYLPVILNPSILLDKKNDLNEFFWPIFYFVKNQILTNWQLPLWNNLSFSGMPLLPDPQSPLFYPLNIIFLLLPLDMAFIFSFLTHTFLGGLGIFLLANKGLDLSKTSSLFASSLYIFTPKTAAYLEAGHFGLVATTAWIPFLALSVIQLIKKPGLLWSIFFALSLVGIFYTHPTTFAVALLASLLVLSIQGSLKVIIYCLIGLSLNFGLTAVTLLPQLEWLPQTTRLLLTTNKDVYPKWQGEVEFIKALFPNPIDQLTGQIDTEKMVALGLISSILAIIGWISLKKKLKIILLVGLVGVLLVALNNISPIYPYLISSDWYALGRVSTRVWFLMIIIVVILSTLGFEKLKKISGKYIYLVAFLALIEILLISWNKINSSPANTKNMIPDEVINFLKNDHSRFRVFCVNRCILQKQAAIHDIELADGYATLQQKNYYDFFIQLSQVYWDKYTLSLPPYEIINNKPIQPYWVDTADYNVKYIVSPHQLTDKKFILKEKFGDYYIYQNPAARSRAYFYDGKEAPILRYLPNYIKVDTTTQSSSQLILAEVWSPGWKAFLNGQEHAEIMQLKNKLRSVNIKDNTKFVEFKYQPSSFLIGKIITSVTIVLIILYFLRWKKESFFLL